MNNVSVSPSSYASMLGDNLFVQMLFTTTIGILIANFSTMLTNIINLFTYLFRNLGVNVFSKKYNSSITVTSISLENAGGILNKSSENYRAVIYIIHKLGINVKKIREQNVNLSIYYHINNTREVDNIYNYDIDNTNEIIIVPELDIRLRSTNCVKDITGKDNSSYSVNSRNIDLFSSKLSVIELLDVLNKWKEEYKEYLKRYVNDGKLYYYSLISESSNAQSNAQSKDKEDTYQDSKIIWRTNIFKSFKTFDNIFFTEKQKLLEKLDFFIKNESWYKNKGIPYNFGLLFHGLPGCGKTSCVKAISNLTNRHVVELSLNKIKTCGQFIDIINNEFINNVYLPIDKRIILIEDIDCMLDIVIDRKLKDEADTAEKEQIANMDVDQLFKFKMLGMTEEYSKCDSYKNEDKLTLSCILNTIDGVLEQHGRILIISTNYPDKLDKALIRPGRIDVRINFTKCDHKMTKDILEFYYDRQIPLDVMFPDFKYTPAEIINKCLNTENKMDDIIKEMTSIS
ncbi:putative AAA+ family ATPase [Tupanvirus soda lake]|uniref:AAA+ family ATPase n=2 Tax=Tupanvirus TaxID=2094720 RepID=A0AC62AAL6_9VIRU|nr:putative AAA+ family ATPase [Tupanvirus soda lake]QKU34779.1 putative AAA+ family ATPase [Tupanvirus soda lake]